MNADRSLRDVERWLSASIAEAKRSLPELLDLPAEVMRRELVARPELLTLGMLQCLLDVALDALERFPRRAYELTSIVVELGATIDHTVIDATILRRLEGCAWTGHARALLANGRMADARAALGTARDLFECDPGSAWYVATVDLVEAPILHESGAHEEALHLVRSAASQFALHRDHERYVEACMIEIWMLWTTGHPAAATDIWLEMTERARQRGDSTLTARIASKLALFELRHGSAEEASRLFASAVEVFDGAGLRGEAIRARWSLAEAMADRGRLHEAISEFYKVHAELLAMGSLTDAALASTEILELLLATGRHGEAARCTETLLDSFRRAGLPLHNLEAFTYLRSCAMRQRLAVEHVVDVRRYFEDLRQQPAARFIPSE